jgi:hypothetical protein
LIESTVFIFSGIIWSSSSLYSSFVTYKSAI